MEDLLYFNFNEKSSVLLIAFINALIFSILLMKNGLREDRAPSKWLAIFLFLGGLYIGPFMFGYANWYAQDGYREFLYFMPFQQLFLIGPVFYFYVRSLLNNDATLKRKDLVHFAPAIAYMIYTLAVFVTDVLILDEYYFYANGRDKDLDFWYQMAGLISMLFYLYQSLIYYRKYRKRVLHEVSYADEVTYKWIKHFAIAFALILILRVLFFILNPEWGQFGNKYWYYLCFSALLVYISISGYSSTIKTSLIPYSQMISNDQPILELKNSANSENNADESIDLSEWKKKIVHFFDVEEIYKNSNLTLSELATKLSTNRNIVSKAINQEFKMNFNDFVNEKRAAAVIEKLNSGEHTRTTLLGIALDCGFNSKSTFNRAFKKHTGDTPKQFILKNKL